MSSIKTIKINGLNREGYFKEKVGGNTFASFRGKAINPLSGVNQYRPLWGRLFILLGFRNLIVHSHAPWFYLNPRALKPLFYQTITRFLTKKKIAVSEGAATAMFGENAQDITLLPAFIDFEKMWQSASENLSLPADFHRYSITFGSVGRVEREKNQGLIIRCLAKLQEKGVDASLVIIGEGGLRPKYEKLVDELDLNDRVYFSGEVDNVAPFYRNVLDVLLVPSLYEGVIRTVPEAQLFGLPVVVSDAVTDSTFLTRECVYRVKSYDEEDWLAAMKERADKAPEKNGMTLERAMAHPTLAIDGGVKKLLRHLVDDD